MTARIIDGKARAQSLRATLKSKLDKAGVKPGLAVILIGDDAASAIYVERKARACAEVGIESHVYRLPANTSQDALTNQIDALNADARIHGILLQLPIPNHLNANDAIAAIHPTKDVDGLTPINQGRLMAGLDTMVPCTPQGVMDLLLQECNDLTGKHAVIIGRSLLFGKPMGQLLLNADCTVTHCHSKTKNIQSITRQADILIAATGQAKIVTSDWVKDGAIVIDVGISRDNNDKIQGDIDFDNVVKVTSAITPVPGGVGPMTIACLLLNTAKAAGLN